MDPVPVIPDPAALPPLPAKVMVPDLPPPEPHAQKLVITPEQVAALMKVAGDFFPSLAKFWPQITALVIAVAGIAGTLGWFVKPVTPPLPPPPGIVAPVTPPVQPGPVAPPIVVPASNKVIVYGTTAIDQKGLPAGATVDEKLWPAGSVYPFGGKSIPLPVMVLQSNEGVVLDVAPYTTPAELTAWKDKKR